MRFQRQTIWPSDTAAADGWGNPAKPNGLIFSMFRPSDDGTIFPYLVPSNYFAVVSLRQLADLVSARFQQPGFMAECRSLADEFAAALRAMPSSTTRCLAASWPTKWTDMADASLRMMRMCPA